MGSERYVEAVDGADLKEQRLARHLSLREVARRAGKPNSYTFLGRLERGERHTLSPQLAWGLIEALGIEPHQIKHYFRFHGYGAPSRNQRAA